MLCDEASVPMSRMSKGPLDEVRAETYTPPEAGTIEKNEVSELALRYSPE